jgi:hypothetical protein
MNRNTAGKCAGSPVTQVRNKIRTETNHKQKQRKKRKKTKEKNKIPSFQGKKITLCLQQYFKNTLTAQINSKHRWERESEAGAHTTGQPEKDTPNVREHNKRSERPQTCEETTGDGPSGETETPGHPVPCHTRAKACVVLLLTSS